MNLFPTIAGYLSRLSKLVQHCRGLSSISIILRGMMVTLFSPVLARSCCKIVVIRRRTR